MSMRYLTKLAGGVVLASAALAVAAPATALAASDEGPSKSDRKPPKTFNLKDKQGNGVTCATTTQINEQNITQIIKDNTISHSVVTFNLGASAAASNTAAAPERNIVVCIRDIDVDVDVKTRLLTDLLTMVEDGLGPAAVGQRAGITPAPGGAYAGPEGAWVLPRTAGVAAGDGGSLAGTDTGALGTAGAGLMGVGVLGGLALLRRRSANGTVA